MRTGISRRNERRPRFVAESGSGGAPESAGRTAPGGAMPTLGPAFDLDALGRRSRLLPVCAGLPALGDARDGRLHLAGRSLFLARSPGGLLRGGLLLRRGGERCELGLVEPPLPDAGPLAAALAQVIELGPPDPAARDDLELGDRGRVDGERALDAHPEGDLPDGEGLVEAAALPANHDALEDLHAFPARLHHPDVHADGVAR